MIDNNVKTDIPIDKKWLDNIDEKAIVVIKTIMLTDEYIESKEPARLNLLKPDISDYLTSLDFMFLGDEKGTVIRYVEGVWIKNNVKALEKEIRNLLRRVGISYTISNIREVRADFQICSATKPEIFEVEKDYINFKNGLYNIKTFQLEPHRKDYYSFIQSNYNYNENSKCEIFDKFLMERMINNKSQDIQTIWEIMGYCMQKGIGMRKAFIFVSAKGSTGKSTVVNVTNHIVGKDNTSKVTLDRIVKPFGKAPMANKLVNYYTDLPTNIPINDIGTLKDLITDDELDIEFKGQTGYKQPNIIKQLFSSQRLPYIKNIDTAFTGRWVIIYFNNQIEDPIENWEFDNIINNEAEMEGICAKAIVALKTLKQRGKFISASPEDILDLWKLETDIVYKFIKTCCDRGKDKNDKPYYIRQDELFSKFITYSDASDNPYMIEQKKFTSALKRMGITIGKRTFDKDIRDSNTSIDSAMGKTTEQKRCYIGVKFYSYPDGLIDEDN